MDTGTAQGGGFCVRAPRIPPGDDGRMEGAGVSHPRRLPGGGGEAAGPSRRLRGLFYERMERIGYSQTMGFRVET